jgi:hypothetical protein
MASAEIRDSWTAERHAWNGTEWYRMGQDETGCEMVKGIAIQELD